MTTTAGRPVAYDQPPASAIQCHQRLVVARDALALDGRDIGCGDTCF
jgi:hypothetical protein